MQGVEETKPGNPGGIRMNTIGFGSRSTLLCAGQF